MKREDFVRTVKFLAVLPLILLVQNLYTLYFKVKRFQ